MRRRARGTVVGLGLLGATMSASQLVRADELTAAERQRLGEGWVVTHEDTVEDDAHRYVGGVSYVMIDAPPDRVSSALDDVFAYARMLPRARSVRWMALSRGGDAVVEIEQGTSLVHGRYTMRLHHDRVGDRPGDTLRFELDPSYAHDIADARGFFFVQPAEGGRSLLTCAILVDLGPGVVRRLFEDKVRRAALSTPLLVRRYVEDSAGDVGQAELAKAPAEGGR